PQGDDDRMLPPTLAVEVRSPDETMDAQRTKGRFYRAHGVDVAWLIDPESRTVELFDEAHDGQTLPSDSALESSYLPGFSLPLAELFAVLDR
ncbi:MAG: Uma2 family endonuclease, partial [Tepidiformaceae bacterium]